MAYEPSVKTKAAIDAVQAQRSRIFTEEELAKVMTLPKSQARLYLDGAVKHGLIFRNPKAPQQYAAVAFSDNPVILAPSAAASANPPAYVPPRMVAPRPGSEAPRAASTPIAPSPTPAPASGLCPGCTRATCAANGCVSERLKAASGPAAAAADAAAVASPPAPAPAPTSAPTPTPQPTPAPTVAPKTMAKEEPEVPQFIQVANNTSTPLEIAGDKDGKVVSLTARHESMLAQPAPDVPFDVQISLRTGGATIFGVKVNPDGSVELTPEQRAQIGEWLAPEKVAA